MLTEITWNHTYKYLNWPVECLVQLYQKHYCGGGEINYEFKIVGDVTYHINNECLLIEPILVRKNSIDKYIFELDNLITSIEDFNK